MRVDLIEHWQNFDMENAPFIHPADQSVFKPRERMDYRFDSLADYVHSSAFGNPGNGLHLNLLPMPFAGDLNRADVFILLLNPGFETADYLANAHGSQLRDACVSMFKQRFENIEFPFVFLNPEFCSSGGYRWWEGKLRDVTRVYSHRSGKSYLDALRAISKRIAAIEYFPYSSNSGPKGLHNLPSSKVAREYVQTVILPRARAGEITLIVTRKSVEWGIASGEDDERNIIVYGNSERRAAHITSKTRGGRAILERLTVEQSARTS